jgi:hypothetical protein
LLQQLVTAWTAISTFRAETVKDLRAVGGVLGVFLSEKSLQLILHLSNGFVRGALEKSQSRREEG